MTIDKNCLTYWFPRLVAAGVPVPRTEIVDAGENWHHLLGYFDDPKRHPGEIAKAKAAMNPLAESICRAADRIGEAPFFLRTGQGSGKHNWKRCCDLRDLGLVEGNILNLVEWSEMVDMMGLSWRYWVVRERLPVKPIAVLPGYGDMPLVREMRCFVEDGSVVCSHPYWPRDAIRDGLLIVKGMPSFDGGDFPELDKSDRELEADRLYTKSLFDSPGCDEITRLAQRVAAVFDNDGAWSVDILETSRGFYVTDMAVGERSFHWPECDKKKPK